MTAAQALIAFGSVSFTYFAYTGLLPPTRRWLQHLGFSTLAIGSLASMQSATRLVSPYAWGWLADHSGRARCCCAGRSDWRS